MKVKENVELAIKTNHILVYSKSYCPYSQRAKKLLESIPKKVSEAKVYELDLMGQEGEDIQAYLLERTKQRTVPNIFIAQTHIGGSDDLVNLHSAGALEPMILARSRIYSSRNKFEKLKEGTSNNSTFIVLMFIIFGGVGILVFRRLIKSRNQNLKEKL